MAINGNIFIWLDNVDLNGFQQASTTVSIGDSCGCSCKSASRPRLSPFVVCEYHSDLGNDISFRNSPKEGVYETSSGSMASSSCASSPASHRAKHFFDNLAEADRILNGNRIFGPTSRKTADSGDDKLKGETAELEDIRRLKQQILGERLYVMDAATVDKFKERLELNRYTTETGVEQSLMSLILKESRFNSADSSRRWIEDDIYWAQNNIFDKGCIPQYTQDNIPTPKPEYTFGFYQDTFTSLNTLLEKHRRLYTLANGLVVGPFYAIEWKSSAGSFDQAMLQARRTGAAMVRARRTARAYLDHEYDFRKVDKHTICFTSSFTPRIAGTFVHWCLDDENNNTSWYMATIYLNILNEETAPRISGSIEAILEWAVQSRKPEVQHELDSFAEQQSQAYST